MFFRSKSRFQKYFLVCFVTSLLISNPFKGSAQLIPGTQTEKQEAPTPEWAADPLGRRTPRGTVSGFINAVSERNYSRASEYLNLEQITSEQEGEKLAASLQKLLDRGGNIMPYSWISNENSGSEEENLPANVDQVGTVIAGGEEIQLYVESTEGPDGGPIWLFASETMQTIAGITIRDTLLLERIMPDVLHDNLWGGVPVGQWIAAVLLAVFAYLLAWSIVFTIRFIIGRTWKKAQTEPTSHIIKALALPVRLYLAVLLFVIISQSIGISIILRQKFSGITLIIGLLAFLILLWSLTEFIGSFSKQRMSHRGNVSGVSVVLFLQRAAKVAIVIFGIIAILGSVGVDVTTGLAALGIGGIALALGAQKTIENFVGSVTVIADQPVRVGDFCKVGDTVGTVEKIGMRSTRIRTLARTVVTIPNGQFSSENIENYAHRDRFWFHTVLSLRYETTPDQIRYLLVELRSVLYAHPMVSPDPARVRFIELGADSINLEVFAYVTVKTFDEFLEVREDLLLQLMDVVGESGTGFAFPSQTIYFGRDEGLSKEKSRNAEEKVRKWKEEGALQIPTFDPGRIEQIKDKTPYPPEGSTKRNNAGTGKIPGL
ncbi:mechanosensitive ion channel family protein [Autumnicola edwardsiae]|uniref:Mechanosensitive ion channel family protein n=1 Tax=Autumnicola edwardsiae TaxID=3075594 RepID=A0ABU3CS48_9FLAO|nr:mechanosensitive ion channel family protein [Zunongwangia sp. F297]MDT0649191.1 mechanosensitive ion channel family protein [Zunongwangia sp. F297]